MLASTQCFCDSRLDNPGDGSLFEKLEGLVHQAVRLWNRPDAGLWELRTRQQVHTYSAVMCWAACDRLAKIATRREEADYNDVEGTYTFSLPDGRSEEHTSELQSLMRSTYAVLRFKKKIKPKKQSTTRHSKRNILN